MLSTSARRAHDDRHLICLTRPSVNAPTYCVVREACCRKKGRVLRQVTDFCYLHTRLKAYITRHGVPLGHYGPTGQGDRTVLIIPLSWCRTGSTAASAAALGCLPHRARVDTLPGLGERTWALRLSCGV